MRSRPRFSLDIRRGLLLLCALFAVGMAAITLLNVDRLKSAILSERELMLRNATQTAFGVIDYYYRESQSGKLTVQQAQAQALAAVRGMRYGAKHDGYFWITNDAEPIPTVLMHPIVPAFDGKAPDAPKFDTATAYRAGIDAKSVRTDGKINI